MAPSPIHNKLDNVSYEILLNGEALSGEHIVKEITVEWELNKIPYATVVVVDGDPSEENYELSENDSIVPGATIKINAGYHQEHETIFEGIIIHQNANVLNEGVSELTITCKSKASKMTVERKNKYFPNKTDSDIFSEIIGSYGLTANVTDTPSVSTDSENIQYYTTDWDYVVSRAEFCGHVVKCEADEITIAPPEVSGEPVLTLLQGTSIIKSTLRMNSDAQYSGVTASAWDSAAQKMVTKTAVEPSVNSQGNVDGSAMSDTLGSEYNMHSSAPLEPEFLQSWADARLLKARMARIKGSLSFYGSALVKPDTLVEVKGMGARYNGNAYVSGVFHRIKEGSWVTEAQIGLTEDWFTETAANVTPTPAAGVTPAISGLQIGKVQKIHEDPNNQYRVLVDVPTIVESGDGVWARLSNFYASNTFGNFIYPEIGDEVILGFLNSDPRYPVILGSVYSGTNVAPYEPDDKNTYKAFVTATQMKIEFEDVKKIITILTPAGNIMTFSDDEKFISIVDENSNEIVMNPDGISIYTPKDLVIKADGKITMESGTSTALTAGTDFDIGALNITNSADVGFKAEGTTAELKGSGQAAVKGGVVMIN